MERDARKLAPLIASLGARRINMKRNFTLLLSSVVMLAVAVCFAADNEPKITQITIERRPSAYPESPHDTVTLRSDGTASFVGMKNVDRIGRFSGTLPEHYFGPAFDNVAEIYMLFRGKGVSTGKPTSNTTSMTIRVIVDGKEERIVDHCPGLDHHLFSLEMAVLGIAADIKWKKQEAEAPNK